MSSRVQNIYNLPIGWVWFTLDEGTHKITDGSHNPPTKESSGIPMLSAQNITNNHISFENVRYISNDDYINEYERANVEAGDVLLTIVGSIGRVAFVHDALKQKFAIQRSVALIKPSAFFNGRFLMYAIQAPFFQKQLEENAKGTAQKGVYLGVLKTFSVPLAPLNEQHQIVNKIEEIFSEIDHVETALFSIKRQLNFYWQTILNNAFCGNISKEYQTATPKGKSSKSLYSLYEIPIEWKWSELGIHTDFVGAGSTPKGGRSIYVNSGIPFIRSQNVLNYSLSLNDIAYITDTINEKMFRTQTQTSDVLLNITGASIGRSAYIPENFAQANVNQHVCIIRTNPSLFYKYLSLFLNSPTIQRLIQEWSSGATREALTLSQIRSIPIPICSIEEQKYIVAELESQHTIIEHIRNSIEMMIAQIQILKQSVLNKAFEGRLVPQNSSDESASELLKKIKTERIEYLQNKSKEKKVKIKIKKMERTKSVFDLLKEAQKPVSAKEVWQQSKHWESIDDFYAELKSISDSVEQTKSKTEILLSLKK
ncbi:MAG: hypothetical protein A2X18_12540 [Bacteroidetes bacterium GWF2_40_14]|nr:MAG: hypothetical protein A2X18_12540 [Bacteroidetes bacterium GWF2_40_14]